MTQGPRLHATAIAIACLLWSAAAAAQGNDAATAASQAGSPDTGGEVQIGAGSTSAVTTGSSGPSDAANPGLPGGTAPFDVTPPRDAFLGPRSLPIVPPRALRCDLIADANAKARCRAGAQSRQGGSGG
ncbi:MAG: hypothetical protein M5U07_26010 [Xanthobacteraceae bacterium]|nr:hypothetical protein [Xanthobacteraceae bacterium]